MDSAKVRSAALPCRRFAWLFTALLIAGALSVSAGPAPAAGPPQPPQIVSVRLEQPDSAYVTFRETNDVGADVQSGGSNEICADWSSAGTDLSPLPCGISGVDVTDANMPIRDYDFTYYCDGSFRFQVSALFDTRPLSSDPSDANNHRAFEMLTDGNTKIIVNWSCPTDPWGVADTSTCTQRGDPSVQNPMSSVPVQSGPLPLSVRFLDDSNRQQLAVALRKALNAPSGSNLPLDTLVGSTTPTATAAAGSITTT